MKTVAIVGYGYMGEIRRRVVESNPEFKLIQVCETRENVLNQGGYPFQVTRSIKDVIEGPADVVFVCTPNHLIPEITIECLKRGKHVFAEKPPGRSLADIEAMRAQELKSPGVKLMFGFNHRFHPGIQRAKRHMEGGKFGKMLWMRGLYGKSGGMNYKKSWRNDKDVSGGGILLDQGIHMLDLFCYLGGDFPRVKAFTGDQYWKLPVEDNAFVILENDKNQHAMLHSSATFWKHRFQIEIGMEEGYLIVQGLLSKTGSYGRETLIVGRKQFEDEADAVGNPSEEITYFDKDASWEMEMDLFFQSILKNEPVATSNSLDALKVMKIVEQAYVDDGKNHGTRGK